MADDRQLQLSAHLTEYSRLYGENHATFQRQQQQVNTMVILASAAVGLFFTQRGVAGAGVEWYCAIVPVPFLVLSFAHIRDDLKIHALDEYVYLILRPRIMHLTALNDRQVWNWLQVADNFKYEWPLQVLSLARYAFPMSVIFIALAGYLFTSSLLMESWMPIVWWHNLTRGDATSLRDALFWIDTFTFLILFGGGYSLVKRGGRYIEGYRGAWLTRGLALDSSGDAKSTEID